jgi:hypothetical protein
MASRKAAKRKVRRLVLTGTNHEVREELFVHGVKPPLVRYERSIDVALVKLRDAGVIGETTKRRATAEAGDPARVSGPG